MLKSFSVENDLSIQTTGAVEVIVELENGQRRWCYFLTPQALTVCGDWIDGTQIHIHYASPYMIVVSSQLNQQIISQALRHIDQHGELEASTMELPRIEDKC